MGQTLLYENRDTYAVTAVMADVPEMSHVSFQFVLAIQSHPIYAESLAEQQWKQNAWYTYFVLAGAADANQLQDKLPGFVDKHRIRNDEEIPEAERGRGAEILMSSVALSQST